MSAASLDLQVGDRVFFEHVDGQRWHGVIERIVQDESTDGEPVATVVIDGGGIGVVGHLEGFEPEAYGPDPACVWFGEQS